MTQPVLQEALALFDSRVIDEQGAIGENQASEGGYKLISAQVDQEWILRNGIVKIKPLEIDAAVRAIEYGFAQQNPDKGNFANNVVGVTDEFALASADAFFMRSVGASVLHVKNQDWTSASWQQACTEAGIDCLGILDRINALLPKIKLAMDWLYLERDGLYTMSGDQDVPNCFTIIGLSFLLNSVVLESEYPEFSALLLEQGERFIQDNDGPVDDPNQRGGLLDFQNEQGYFLEKGGPDSSYQGINSLFLSVFYLWSRNVDLRGNILDAVARAMPLEVPKIDTVTGHIEVTGNTRTGECQERGHRGDCKNPNYREVSLAFGYWAALTNMNDEVRPYAEPLINCTLANDCPPRPAMPTLTCPLATTLAQSDSAAFAWEGEGDTYFIVFPNFNTAGFNNIRRRETHDTSFTASEIGKYYTVDNPETPEFDEGAHTFEVAGCNDWACLGPVKCEFSVVPGT